MVKQIGGWWFLKKGTTANRIQLPQLPVFSAGIGMVKSFQKAPHVARSTYSVTVCCSRNVALFWDRSFCSCVPFNNVSRKSILSYIIIFSKDHLGWFLGMRASVVLLGVSKMGFPALGFGWRLDGACVGGCRLTA